MKHTRWYIILGSSLLISSAALYTVHFLLFHDLHHILIYFLGDLAFVPVEVLIVTLIIHRFLYNRERKIRIEKLTMVIGVFFSQMGRKLLTIFLAVDPARKNLEDILIIKTGWRRRDFARVRKYLQHHAHEVVMGPAQIEQLKGFLSSQRDFLVRLLENPVLLEHEPVTDLFQATLHLAEELAYRPSFADIPGSDKAHLAKDMQRVYILLLRRWILYMRYLKDHYPYLFSLAARTNPFDTDASICVS